MIKLLPSKDRISFVLAPIRSGLSKVCLVAISFILITFSSIAQLTTTTGQTATELVQDVLLGTGVTASNISFTGSANAIGSFTATGTNLGIDNGVVLTTGTIVDNGDGPQGPNDEGNCGTNNGIGGYPPLTTLLGGIPTYNAAVLDFDFVPSSDTVQFSFVFGSEEYPEYVGSGFNDAFAFFISGPGIVGTQNIAQLPDGTPITINNVNNGFNNGGPCNNCAYYVNNGTGSNAPYNSSTTYIQYDGFTSVLTAVSQVECGETYHLTIAIADAGDGSFDSGVFLKAGSLTSSIPPSVDYALSFSIPNDSNTMGEGCAIATLTVDRGTADLYSTLVLPIGVSGTATEGVDFSDIPNTLTFNPGVQTAQFSFSSLFDGITEGLETIQFSFPFFDECGNPITEYVDVNIIDNTQMFVSLTTEVESLCYGESTTITANVIGGTPDYTYDWSNGETTQEITVGGGTYTVIANDQYGCVSAQRVITIDQNPLPIDITAGSLSDYCYDNVGEINLTGSVQQATGGIWTGGAGTFNPNNTTINTGYTPTPAEIASGSLTLTLTSTGNGDCPPASDQVTISFFHFDETITLTPQNVSCNGENDGSATVSTSGAYSPSTFSWDGAAATSNGNVSNLSPGNHTIQIFNSMGCDTTLTFTITEPESLTASISSPVSHLCFGEDPVEITSTVSGGTSPYVYSWSDGTNETTANGSNDTYSLTVTDANGCEVVTNSETISQDLLPIASNAGDDIEVCYDFSGTVTLNGSIQTATGGTWSGGSGAFSPNANNLSATYTPTASEIQAGFVDLTLTTTGNNGCPAASNEVRISFLHFDETITFSSEDISCFGQNDGSATVSTSGTYSPCTYSWDGGASSSSNSISGLLPGPHTLQLFNSMGCDTTLNFTINEPTTLAGSIAASPTHLCFDASPVSITSDISGGTLPYDYAWSSGEVTADITGTNDTFTLTVTDNNGCTIITNSVTITQDAQPILAIAGDDQFYCSTFTGAFTLNGSVQTASGGIWANGLGTFSTSNTDLTVDYTPTTEEIESGQITLTLTTTGNNNCPAHTDSIDIFFLDFNETIVQNIIDVSCYSLNNGSNEITTSGTYSPCTFSWDNSPITANNSISNLAPGIHSVEIYNTLGCSERFTFTITEPDSLTLSIVPTPAHLCYGEPEVSIISTVTGGTAPYSYIWNNGDTTANTTGANGNYILTIDDNNGCGPLSENVFIPQDSLPIQATAGDDQFFCPDFSGNIVLNGSIQTAPGGTWTGGLGNFSPSSDSLNTSYTPTQGEIDAGLISLILTSTGNNGCPEGIDTVEIHFTPFSETVQLTLTPITCFGFDNGVAEITTSGLFSPCTYSWDGLPVSSDSVQTDLTPGTHSVILFNASGCDTTINFLISEPTQLEASISPDSAHLCFGESPIEITTTVSGGTTPYSYDWGASGTSSSITVGAGNYQVNVSDANNCPVISLNSIITQDSLPIEVNAGNDIELCADFFGGVNLMGSFQISSGAYWSNGIGNYSSDSSSMNLTYTPDSIEIAQGFVELYLTSEGNHNCPGDIDSVLISFLDFTESIELTYNNITCFGLDNGIATVITSGEYSPCTFDWDNLGETSQNSIDSLSPGIHQVRLINSLGCDSTLIFIISEPEVLSLTTTPERPHLCFSDSTTTVSTQVSGGTEPYNYLWSDSTTQSTLISVAGTFSLVVTDSNGCSISSDPIFITHDEVEISANAGLDLEFCSSFTGSFDLNGTVETATGGIWQGGNGIFSPSDSSLTNTYAPTQDEIDGGIITLSLITTGNNGCPADTSFISVQFLDFVEAIQFEVSQVTCNGLDNATAEINVTGNYSPCQFIWDNGTIGNTTTLTDIQPGDHTIQIVNQMGCDTTFNYTISEPEPLTAQVTPINHVLCYNETSGRMSVQANGGTLPYTYTWNGIIDNDTMNNLSAGSYTCVVTDANNCFVSATNFITEPDSLSTVINMTLPLCNGDNTGSLDAFAFGGTSPYTYNWSTGSDTSFINNLAADTYFLTITDANNCQHIDSEVISEPAALAMQLPNDTLICPGASLLLNANVTGGTGNYTYAWTPSNTTSQFLIVTPVSDTVFTCQVKDANGCLFVDSLTIRLQTLVNGDVSAFISDSEICQNDPISLNASYNGNFEGVSLQWLFCMSCDPNNSVVVNPTQSTDYIIMASNSCNMQAFDTVSVLVHIPPIINLLPTYGNICPENYVSLMNYGQNDEQWTYNWTLGDGTSAQGDTVTHLYNFEGNYPITLSITDQFNCTSYSDGESFVVVHPQAIADFDFKPFLGTMADPSFDFINNSINANSYSWDFGDSTFSDEINPSHEYEYEGIHTITLTAMNQYGCNAEISKNTFLEFDYTIYAPNAFTPDGYGPNNDWNIKFTGLDDDYFTLRIFNRWGELIHETHDINEGWNGTRDGDDRVQKDDVYVWTVDYNDIHGNPHYKDGIVTLLK
jgi:gliding motility-associated-like protein